MCHCESKDQAKEWMRQVHLMNTSEGRSTRLGPICLKNHAGKKPPLVTAYEYGQLIPATQHAAEGATSWPRSGLVTGPFSRGC